MAESKYKVGDEVTIKNLHNAGNSDYRFGLNDIMREASGKSFTIRSIKLASPPIREIPDDGYEYELEGICWSWASSMFEDSSKKLSTGIFVRKKKRPKMDFSL